MTMILDSIYDFLNAPTQYHAANKIQKILTEHGYQEFQEGDYWEIRPGTKGFVKRNGSAIIAFYIPEIVHFANGIKIGMAHTDCPLLRLRIEDAESINGNQLRIPTDIYGGAINASWLDRPLAIAGQFITANSDSTCDMDTNRILIDTAAAIAIIPNPPPHLQRNLNSNDFSYGAKQLCAIVNAPSLEYLFEMLEIPNNTLATELYLHDAALPQIIGSNLISAQHLDNLLGCYAILYGLVNQNEQRAISMGCFFDNEEIGSQSAAGADGSFLKDIMDRILFCLDTDPFEQKILCSNGWIASVDAAHAYNPNYPEIYDFKLTPHLNGGIVLKNNVNFKYATTIESEAYFKLLCKQYDIHWQNFQVPAGSPCGSTVGPIMASSLGMKCIDLGSAMWAMHSIRETAGLDDIMHLTKFMYGFFN